MRKRKQRRKLIASAVEILAILGLILTSIAPALAAGGQQFNHYWIEARAQKATASTSPNSPANASKTIPATTASWRTPTFMPPAPRARRSPD